MNAILDWILHRTKVKPLPDVVVSSGSLHVHEFTEVPWDIGRHGPSLVDPDKDYGGPLEFPMATFKELFRCECGAEVIRGTRSLI